tara:strand:- start:114 stop:245 length:132 start_codon:yes stop_codon:yes gene_type:complete
VAEEEPFLWELEEAFLEGAFLEVLEEPFLEGALVAFHCEAFRS